MARAKPNKMKNHGLFAYQGLPIAALSLIFLLVLLLIAVNMTRVNEEDQGFVQGVVKVRKTTVNVSVQTGAIDSIIRQIDTLMKSNNKLSDNLSDLK